jgi:chromosome segregation ATPase
MEQYRTAFCRDTKKNDPLEHNLEKIVHLASQKLKEFINTKQEKLKENNLLKGQMKVLLSDIDHFENESAEKENQILKLNEEYLKVRDEVEQIEMELKENLDTYDVKSEQYKHTVTAIKSDIDSVSDMNNIEESNKNSFLKQEYEQYYNLKENNKLLVEQLYQLRRDLYHFEVSILVKYR